MRIQCFCIRKHSERPRVGPATPRAEAHHEPPNYHEFGYLNARPDTPV